MIEYALKYLKLGWSPIPIKPGGDKIPLVKWKDYQTKLPTVKIVTRWWEKWPKANIGIITGKLSNIFSIDFDRPEAKAEFEARFEELPESLSFETGRGSQHVFRYVSYGGGNKANIIEKVDIRGEGGLIVVPPSIHSSGKIYKWCHINPLEHGLDDLMDMPPARYA